MSDVITELLELHEKWGNTCSECEITNDAWESEAAPWPCDTVEVIYKHYPELAEETK